MAQTLDIAQDKIRNIAIIAHVDHGKTTLVDQLFQQSGLFRDNQAVQERMMDSMDLEKERGITITSKNGAFMYKDHRINIIDTPGHADFGGQVERVLMMADGAVLLVDAQEGPMPQTYFVLRKALERKLPILVVVNKIDKPAARPDWVVDQVFDLFVLLDAPDELLDFTVVFASAKEGVASMESSEMGKDFTPLFDSILEKLPAPNGDVNKPVQILVSSLSYSSFLGRLAIGKVSQGNLKVNQEVVVSDGEQTSQKQRITKIYTYSGNDQVEVQTAKAGDIIAVGGLMDVMVGQTITDPNDPCPLPKVEMDPPTISMTFIANDSPFSGKEGEFVTGRHVKDRLMRETLADVALDVQESTEHQGLKVSGRGELHISILIEKMRREGYEFQVTRPTVIIKEVDGKKMEPYEELTVEVSEESQGRVIESLGMRKGELLDMTQMDGITKIKYKIPTRGLLGYRSQFMTETKGMGLMNTMFLEYGPYVGDLRNRKLGAMVVKDTCKTIAFALFNLQERGTLFVPPGVDVYRGQVIGEYSRNDDLVINPAKGKKLTNMRASGSDDTVVLTPHRVMSLEDVMAFINDDEIIEVTPKNIRIRKRKMPQH